MIMNEDKKNLINVDDIVMDSNDPFADQNGSGTGEIDEESKEFAKRLGKVNQAIIQNNNANTNHLQPQATTITTTTGDSTPTITDEDYAAELQSEFNKEGMNHNQNQHSIHMPSNQTDDYHLDNSFELPQIVSHSEDYHRFIALKRTATIIKAFCLLIFFFSIMTYFIQAWWLIFSFGLVMCPVGFYASHYLNRRLFFFFMIYISVDIIFRLGYLFSHLSQLAGFGIFLSIVLDALEGYVLYFSFNFYKKMPRDGTITFREFYLHDAGLFSI